MGLCPDLKVINLIDNPVTELPNYRNSVKESIPQLLVLDDVVFFDTQPEQCTEISSSEYQSSPDVSFNTTHSVDSTEHPSNNETPLLAETSETEGTKKTTAKERPLTSCGVVMCCEELEKNQIKIIRPKTAVDGTPTQSLTSGQPLCGSIISTVRKRRSRRTAWGGGTPTQSSSISSSSSSQSSSMSEISPTLHQTKDFPKQLPQKSVDLELGVIGGGDCGAVGGSSGVSCDDEKNNLLEAAKKWRQTSQKTRELVKHSDNLRILNDYTSTD